MNWPGIYRKLLKVYPPAFRERFGQEMESAFEQGLSDSDHSDWYVIGALTDAAKGGLKERCALLGVGGLIVWAGCVALGLAIGRIDSHAEDPQGTLLVLMLSTGLIGSIWRRGGLVFSISLGAGIPIMDLLLTPKTLAVGPVFLFIIPVMIGYGSGAGIRKLLESQGEGAIGWLVVGLAGALFGLTELLLAFPIILAICSLCAGVGLGRSAPRRAYVLAAIMAVSVLATEAALASGSSSIYMRFRAMSPSRLPIDFGIALLAILGAGIGVRFKDDPVRPNFRIVRE